MCLVAQSCPALCDPIDCSLPGSSVPAEVEGNEGFPPPPEKDLESPSSTRLEALVASHDGVPLRGEGSCGGGGAPRDSAGSGATEEGLTSRGGRNLRLPLRLGQEDSLEKEMATHSSVLAWRIPGTEELGRPTRASTR